MALTEIEYGSLASSEVINNNFEYLDNKIADVSDTVAANKATLNSNVASINSSIESMETEINASLNTVNTKLNGIITSGCYITTYINGTSWYREYFSDPEKTSRVWLEQGFTTPQVSWSDNDLKTYNLVKSFSDTNYTVVAVSTTMFVGNGVSSGNIAVEANSATQISIGNDAHNAFGVRVYACGK